MEKNGPLRNLRGRRLVTPLAVCFAFPLLSACVESGVISEKPDPLVAASDGISADGGQVPITSDDSAAAGQNSLATDEADVDVLKIMAVGDSITHGVAGAKSYRQPLIDLLNASGCEFEMVGSMNTNLPDTGFESPHEAYSGHRTDSFLTGQQSSFGNNEGISVSMMQFEPQLILLKIGTNDISQNRDIDNVIANIDQIVALIFNVEPESDIVISTLVPYFKSADPDNPVNVRLELFSEALRAWVIQAAHPRVHLIDIRQGFSLDMMLPDLIHPGDVGDAFIADRFFQSVEQNELCG